MAQPEDGSIREAEKCCCYKLYFNCNYLIKIVLGCKLYMYSISFMSFLPSARILSQHTILFGVYLVLWLF
jgi:hypothetical protein